MLGLRQGHLHLQPPPHLPNEALASRVFLRTFDGLDVEGLVVVARNQLDLGPILECQDGSFDHCVETAIVIELEDVALCIV